MKTCLAYIAERNVALRERDAALLEKKEALVEKKEALAALDMAIRQRDNAISERNSAISERDHAFAALQYNGNNLMIHLPPGPKHIDPLLQLAEVAYCPREVPFGDVKPSKAKKQTKENKALTTRKNVKRGMKVIGEDLNTELRLSKVEWKDKFGMNHIGFDERNVLVPVCSCTGELKPCYKWGNGGWQSACCTTTLSMYPLPQMPNKRRSRLSGRKMSGGAFSKLINRLASEGRDLSGPVDLKDHWNKHGTNRYITIK